MKNTKNTNEFSSFFLCPPTSSRMLQQVKNKLAEGENRRGKKRKGITTTKEEYDEIRGHMNYINENSKTTLWSELPYDIINEIANRLETIEDFLAFSFVCKSWQSIYRDKTWLSSPKIPWLMLDVNHNGECCYSLYKKKILKIPLPKAHDRQIWGSSHGWLIMIGSDFNIQLLNPITQVKINLPHVSTFEKVHNIVNIDWFNLVHKASVFKLGNEFLATVIYGPKYSLAFAKLGAMTWTNVNSRLIFTSVVCYKGKILGLSINGTLAIIEIDELERKPPIARCLLTRPVGGTCWEKLYLAESRDDLLLVCRHSTKMMVYRFDILSWEWKKMESLGDRVLFLDEHSCLSASSCVGTKYMKTDCIYYSQDNLQCLWGERRNYIQAYNLKNKKRETIFLGSGYGYLRYGCPVWLIPSLCSSSSNSKSKDNKMMMTITKKLKIETIELSR